MSYVVMARKYRPMSFAELKGQDHVVRTLQNAIRKNRLSHAYIFSGTRGVGKTTAARILAKAMNCEAGPAPEPCNHCRSCLEVNEGRSLDVIEIDGASNRGIDEVRQLRENVKYAPASSRFKIYIIDEVHMLTEHAFNALLKTLEEPPPHVKFIMATTAPDKIPTTIQSRCQRFDFRLLTREEIVAQLEETIGKEGLSLSRKILHEVARAAEGSVRDALSLLEQVISFAGEDPDPALVEEVLHLVRTEVLDRFLGGVAARDAADLIRIIDELAARGFDMRRFLQELMEWIRGMMLVSVSPDLVALIPLAVEDRQLLTRRAVQFSRGRLQTLIETVIEAERELKQAVNPRYCMEAVALKMAQTADFDTLENLAVRLEELGRRIGGAAAVTPVPEPTPAAVQTPSEPATATAEPADLPDAPPDAEESADDYLELTGEEPAATPSPPRDAWQEFVEEVKKRKIGLGSFLEHGRLTSRDDKGLVIGFTKANRFFLESAQEKHHLSILNEVAGRVFGNSFRVRLELVEGESGEEPPAGGRKDTDLAKKKREEALKNPLVQEIIDAFGGQVLEVKILHTLRNEEGAKG